MTWILIISGLGAIVVAIAGGVLTDTSAWYRSLRKPSWQPPDWAFGPVWTVILALSALAAALGWQAAPGPATRSLLVSLFVANGLLNILWSLLFFRLRRPDWALIEVVPLWFSVLALMVALAPYDMTAAAALAPYLVWVGIASFLNLTIVRLNRPFGAVAHRT